MNALRMLPLLPLLLLCPTSLAQNDPTPYPSLPTRQQPSSQNARNDAAGEVTRLHDWKPTTTGLDYEQQYEVDTIVTRSSGKREVRGSISTSARLKAIENRVVEVQLTCAAADATLDNSDALVVTTIRFPKATFDLAKGHERLGHDWSARYPMTFVLNRDGEATPSILRYTYEGGHKLILTDSAARFAQLQRYYSLSFAVDYADVTLMLDVKEKTVADFISLCHLPSPRQKRIAARESK